MFIRLILCAALVSAAASLFAQNAQQRWESRVTYGPAWEGVPEYYRKMLFPEWKLPDSRGQMEKERSRIREVLRESLGEMPPRPGPPRARTVSTEQREGFRVEKLEIDNGIDAIPAYMVIPAGLRKPAPAILLLHWHSGDKDGPVFSASEQNVLAPLLERRFIVLSVDAAFNGERLGRGPAGLAEQNINQQRDSLFKLDLWFGRTLFGMMLRDNMIAIDYLVSRPEVDKEKIAASGMSMGATGAWWLAAMDDRVKAVVAVACFTRYRELIAHGQLRAHAMYYFVPGILKHFDTEAVLAAMAPRPLLALTGDSDPTSPPDGIRILETKLKKVYGLYDSEDKFRSIIYPNTGHNYIPEMKREMAAWFERWLR